MELKEFKGTKQDWSLGNENNSSCDINIGDTICSLSRWGHMSDNFVIGRDEMLANAHLIIAAPKLLEASRQIMDCYEKNGQLLGFDINILRDAISEALD